MGAVGPVPTPTLAPPPATHIALPAVPPTLITNSAPAARQGGPKPHKGKPGPLVDKGIKGKGKALLGCASPSQAEAHVHGYSLDCSCPVTFQASLVISIPEASYTASLAV